MRARGATYGACVAAAWKKYGHAPPPGAGEEDDLLDRFIPVYEIVERHHIRARAPAKTTLAVARDMDLMTSPVVRAIFRGRELTLGAGPGGPRRTRRLLAEVQSLGWAFLSPGIQLIRS